MSVRASRLSAPPVAAQGVPNERRPLWRRLSSIPPARAGFPHRGGRPAFTAPQTIREESAWVDSAPRPPRAARTRRLRAGVSRLRRLWRDAAAAALASCIGVACFVTDALGLTARARAAYSDLMARAATMRGQFAVRFARGSQLTRKLSAVALSAMGRGMSKTEKVAGLLRRAMSAEGRLDTCGAIRCYQARRGACRKSAGQALTLSARAGGERPGARRPGAAGGPRQVHLRPRRARRRRGGLASGPADTTAPPVLLAVFEPAIFANGDLARSMATQAAHLSERVRFQGAGAQIAAAAACAAHNPGAHAAALSPVASPGHRAHAGQPARAPGVRHLAGPAGCVCAASRVPTAVADLAGRPSRSRHSAVEQQPAQD
jgi:hypothetical protein